MEALKQDGKMSFLSGGKGAEKSILNKSSILE
jgi:hypothetical protein